MFNDSDKDDNCEITINGDIQNNILHNIKMRFIKNNIYVSFLFGFNIITNFFSIH